MEMPIRIIIVLFVSVVVGIAILSFAGKMISDSRMKMLNYNEEENEADRIIDVTSVTSSHVAALAETCYHENSMRVLEGETCFVVLGDVKATESGIEDAMNEFDDERYIIDLDDAENAVQIKYNAIDDAVLITG